jgi:hypothetical protein
MSKSKLRISQARPALARRPRHHGAARELVSGGDVIELVLEILLLWP